MSLQSSGRTEGSPEPHSCHPKHQSGQSHRASGLSTFDCLHHSTALETRQGDRGDR